MQIVIDIPERIRVAILNGEYCGILDDRIFNAITNGTPLEQEPCEDCISRREAIKKFTYNYKGERIPDYDCDNFPVQIAMKTVKEMLRELPPVNPQPKTGHWIIIDDCERFIAKCSECGRIEDSRIINKYPYCHCGAKMVEPQERNDKK